VFINGLVGVSFGMIVFSSALSHIPRELVIAARVDGATNWSISRKILIPMIRWHILYVFTWQLLSLITSYAHTFLLIEWGLVNRDYGTTLSLYVFLTAFGRGEQDQGLAAAAATILAIIGTVLGFLTLKILKFERMIAKPRGDI
jgi:inositol-phosphate transport system permease protein